jgi:hypothetical protein
MSRHLIGALLGVPLLLHAYALVRLGVALVYRLL